MASSTGVQVESIFHPPTLKPPSATNTLILAGAGVQYVKKEGEDIKGTAVSVYLEDKAIQSLAVKWKGKTPQELMDTEEFYNDIATAPFAHEISQLWGNILEDDGKYTDAEADILIKFINALTDKRYAPGASVLFTSSPSGSVTVNLGKDGIISEAATVVLENEHLGATIVEAAIGKINGVSEEAKQSVASRVSEFLK